MSAQCTDISTIHSSYQHIALTLEQCNHVSSMHWYQDNTIIISAHCSDTGTMQSCQLNALISGQYNHYIRALQWHWDNTFTPGCYILYTLYIQSVNRQTDRQTDNSLLNDGDRVAGRKILTNKHKQQTNKQPDTRSAT